MSGVGITPERWAASAVLLRGGNLSLSKKDVAGAAGLTIREFDKLLERSRTIEKGDDVWVSGMAKLWDEFWDRKILAIEEKTLGVALNGKETRKYDGEGELIERKVEDDTGHQLKVLSANMGKYRERKNGVNLQINNNIINKGDERLENEFRRKLLILAKQKEAEESACHSAVDGEVIKNE